MYIASFTMASWVCLRPSLFLPTDSVSATSSSRISSSTIWVMEALVSCVQSDSSAREIGLRRIHPRTIFRFNCFITLELIARTQATLPKIFPFSNIFYILHEKSCKSTQKTKELKKPYKD